MLEVYCSLLVVSAIFGPIESAVRSFPPYIESCKQNDPDLNKCVLENANKAIPHLKAGDKKLKIGGFDPLLIDEATLEPGGNLKLTMKNVKFVGLGNCKVLESDIRLDEGIFNLKLMSPVVEILGDYLIDGRLVILPIKGEGKANITSVDILLTCNIDFKVEEQNGIKQFVVDKMFIDYTASRIYYHFGNLFNGADSRLAKEMEKFLDESWKEIDGEFHSNMQLLLSTIIKSATANIFKDVPYETMFIP